GGPFTMGRLHAPLPSGYFAGASFARRKEVGAALPGAAFGLLAPPARDLAVIAGTQHIGHTPTPELGRPGVLGILEQAVGERLFYRRFLVAEHAGNEAGDGLDN